MALTSVGFAGTVTEANWSLISTFGAQYGVVGAGDFAVSIVPGVDRTVRVATGSAWGRGVLVTSDATADVQLGAVTSGTRWDTIVLRRNRATGTSTILALVGTSSAAIASSREVGWADDKDDQPLALVPVISGSTTVGTPIDLRCWASNGGVVASSTIALDYLAAPGARVVIGDTEWRRVVSAGGAESWDPVTTAPVLELSMSGTVAPGTGTYALPWTVERVKAGDITHSTTTANDDVVIAKAGVYAVSAHFEYTCATGGASRDFAVRKGDSVLTHARTSGTAVPNNPAYYVAEMPTRYLTLALGDKLDLVTSGSSAADMQEDRCSWGVQWVRP